MSTKREGLAEIAHKHIVDKIMHKEFMPGDKVLEQAIADELGISRSPVREAIRRLDNEGLITIFPNRFAQINFYDQKSIIEIGTMRIALDALAVKLSLLYGSRVDFLRLKELAEKCHEAFINEDMYNRVTYDCAFHTELAKISQNELLIKFQKELDLRVQFAIHHTPNIEVASYEHLQQHFQIVDALMEHDHKKAIETSKAHLISFYNLEDKFPVEYFSW